MQRLKVINIIPLHFLTTLNNSWIVHISSNPGKKHVHSVTPSTWFCNTKADLFIPTSVFSTTNTKKEATGEKLKETKYEINKHHQQACSMFSSILSFSFAAAKFTVDYYAKNCLMKFPNQFICGLGSSISFQSWNTDQVNAIAEYNFTFYFIFSADHFFIILIVVSIQWVLFDALVICV